ncbi:DUF4153 domain-containing protein [Streptomyces sp. NPDC056987]|uniref:DUF4153 domain-containing protein n=1 Tax=Streptomyces sp. NPDC056987 TaxID=3345988 RepID=UPI00362F7521
MTDSPSRTGPAAEPDPSPEAEAAAQAEAEGEAGAGVEAGAKAQAKGEPRDAVEPSSAARTRAHGEHHQGAVPPPDPARQYREPWQQWQPRREPPAWQAEVRPEPPARIRTATLWSSLATALLSALLLRDGIGLNLLFVAVPAALAAFFAARAAGRLPRPWTLVWAGGGLVLLAVPALRDAGLPVFLAVVSAVALGALALHGSRTWPGVLLGPVGLVGAVGPGTVWALRGLRERAGGTRGRVVPVLRALAVAGVLLIVFGTLFASADAAFAELLGSLTPDVSDSGAPWQLLLFGLGLLGALAAAHTAASPPRWDRVTVRPGKARGRTEWALPLIVLNLLFAAFIAVQLVVLLAGYDAVAAETGLTPAQYARQGFWQLLWVTLLVLVVIVAAIRWAPRGGARDAVLVRAVLGTLCVLTLVVVAAALRRMDLYVDAFGLTRLRVSVTAMELWLGLVIVLMLVAGATKGRWLPRAVAASAGAGVLAFGLVSPDALVAERNVQRYERTHKIDVEYFRELSADAVPALDRLPEPLRSCALRGIADGLGPGDEPWYATSLAESRARDLLAERGVRSDATCPGENRYRW